MAIDIRKLALKMAKMDNNSYEEVASNSSKHVLYYVDTGNYLFNAQLSGSIFGGYPGGMTTGIAGETQSGKSRLGIESVNLFLTQYPNSLVFYYDTEYAIDTDRFVDPERVIISRENIIETIQISINKKINELISLKPIENDIKTLFVLDSLGAMVPEFTENQLEEIKSDTGRTAKAKKAFFLQFINKIHRANATMLVLNHVYTNIGSMSKISEIGGGSGMKYAAQNIAIISPLKNKDDSDNSRTIKSYLWKGRNVPPFTRIEMVLHFRKGGFQRYSGLLEFCIERGLIDKWVNPETNKISNQFCQKHNPEKHAFRKNIMESPEDFFDAEFLKIIDEETKKYFSFGNIELNNLSDCID